MQPWPRNSQARDELDELYRLDASESEPENEPDDEARTTTTRTTSSEDDDEGIQARGNAARVS